MNIIHVVYSCVPGVYRGGIPKIVHELARAQADRSHQVAIYATNCNGPELVPVSLDRPQMSGAVSLHYFRVQFRRWMSSSSMRAALLRSDLLVDVIHGHNTWLALNRYAADAAQRRGAGLYYHVHGALDPLVVNQGWLKRLRKRAYLALIEKRNYARSQALFANTAEEATQLRHFGVRPPVCIVPNGVSLRRQEEYQGMAGSFRQGHGIAENQPVILFVGRIVPKKGLHLLIPALAKMHRSRPETVLVIVGDRRQDPAYTAALDLVASRANVSGAIRWAGFLDEEGKLGALGAASIFAHPSESEGMAMSVLEAMAAGLPVVVSREAYMGLAAEAGAVMEVERTIEALQAGLGSLLADRGRSAAMGSRARNYVDRHHSWRNVADMTLACYAQHSPCCQSRSVKVAGSPRGSVT